ncbi:MAG TPA: hypothetical protein VNU72_12325, partial [Puia sp.]|nr:hypothetical protein [Puia sp.]
MRANLYLLAFLLLIAAPAQAQQYLFARYTPKDGLINSRARFVYQDSKGRIYVSTFGGLSVYDGARFTNYTTENGLATSLINDVVEMGDDSLWIVPNGQALHCMVHGVIRNIKTADNYYPVVNQLVRCSDGFFYAIADQGLFRFENNRFIRLSLKTDSGKEVNGLLQQAVELNGRLLIVTDANLSTFPDPGAVLVYDLHTHRTILSGKSPKFNFLLRT